MKRFVSGFLAAAVFALVVGEVVAQEASAPTASSSYVETPSTIYSIDFEDGIASGDWKFTSTNPEDLSLNPLPMLMWQIGPVNPFFLAVDPTSPSAWSLNYNRWFNNTNSSDNTVTAGSPSIPIQDHVGTVLRFRCGVWSMGAWFGESTPVKVYDHRFVRIVNLNGELLTSLPLDDKSCPGLPHEHKIPLDPSWGSVRIEFRVETESGVFDTAFSWSVDDVVVEGTPKPAESAVAAAEESKSEPAGGSGSCGCVGLEAVLLLTILAAARRRR